MAKNPRANASRAGRGNGSGNSGIARAAARTTAARRVAAARPAAAPQAGRNIPVAAAPVARERPSNAPRQGGNRNQERPSGAARREPSAPSTPNYSGTPGEFATAGSAYGQSGSVFDGAAWQRAQAAGYSDQQIRDFLVAQQPGKGLSVGRRPQMVLDNWERENPDQYNRFANGPAAQYSTPGRVLFNPEGEKNIGLGRGGLQDYGITWYSTQGSADNDLSKAPYDPKIALNVLLNGKYLQTELGMARAMGGESPVPYRYMGDKDGNPSSEGTYAYGYDRFSEIPAAVRRDFGLTGAAGGDSARKGKKEKKAFTAAETYRQRFDEMKQRFSKATEAAASAGNTGTSEAASSGNVGAGPARAATAQEKPRVRIGGNQERTRISDIGVLYGSARPSGAGRLSAGIGSGDSVLSKFKDDLRASDGLGLGKRSDLYGGTGTDNVQPIRATRAANTRGTGNSAAYYSRRFG